MRWYKVTAGDQTWDATSDPNALNVELDISQYAYHTTNNKSYLRVWGIPLSMILSAKQFNQKSIKVSAGMQKGLPLANPNQQGLLAQGTVFPCVGNWVNTDMTLDFYFAPAVGNTTVQGSANVTHNWQARTQLKTAVQQTLQTAFPQLTPKINISPNLVLNYTDTGIYQSLVQYAQYIHTISKNIITDSKYQGVAISIKGNTITVQDATTQQSGPKTINFQDLIGQPIWTGLNTAQWKTVMRGDFDIGDVAKLPKSQATLTSAAGPQLQGSQSSNIIQGSFIITAIRHVGNFRQSDWPSWCSIFDGTVKDTQ